MVSLKKSTPITFQVYPITPKNIQSTPQSLSKSIQLPQKTSNPPPKKRPQFLGKKIPTAKIRIFIHISTMGHIIFLLKSL